MIRRLDKVWYGLLGRAHRWILCRVIAYSERDLVRQAEAQRRQEALRRLERHLAAQKPHLN